MATFSESIDINAPAQAVWDVLADIGSISSWNPGVTESHQTSDGPIAAGATRHCRLGGKNYLDEQVVVFQPGDAITLRIVGTNLPFAHADIRFTLTDAQTGTKVTVSPDYRLKYGPIGALLDTLFVRRQYRKGMGALLRGLKRHIEA